MFIKSGLYWVWRPMLSPDDGGSAGNAGTDGTNPDGGTGTDGNGGGNNPAGNEDDNSTANLTAELEKMKAEMAKQKKALDEATKEAGDLRKELRSKKTAEEIAAEEKKASEEKTAKELESLRKEVAKAKSTKSVMAKLGVDENAAGEIAESLLGCENVENALLLIQKAWNAREKALRLEFGKITGPGQGGNGEDAQEKAAMDLAKKLGESRSIGNQSTAEGLKGFLR